MVEDLVAEPEAESVTELQFDKAVVVRSLNGFTTGYGLTKDDVPAEVTKEAAALTCANHPDGGWSTGAGYAGGGFGPYRICLDCGTIFGKVSWKDGNQTSA